MSKGGVRPTSGCIGVPDELRRSVALRLQLTPGDKADLSHIAKAWGVPVSTAAYAMVATELAKARGVPLNGGILPIEVMASVHLLAAQRKIGSRGKSIEEP